MKRIYIEKNLNGNYLYSDTNVHDVTNRLEFESYKKFFKYLSSPKLKKLRKRKNLIVCTSLKDNGLEELLKKSGFRSVKIEIV